MKTIYKLTIIEVGEEYSTSLLFEDKEEAKRAEKQYAEKGFYTLITTKND